MSAEDRLEKSIREALEEVGETLTDKAISNIAAWVEGEQENGWMLESSSYAPSMASVRQDEINMKYEARIRDLEAQIETYQKSVKQRRNAERVWTENGRVMFE